MSYRVFIVEDDEAISEVIADFLRRFGYQTKKAEDFRNVEEIFLEWKPDAVILDVNLPFQDGFHLCRQLRRHSSVPILFLSARSGDMEQIMGMESGGDDYITKPFQLEVLHAKLKAILRRTYGEYAQLRETDLSILRVGNLQLDRGSAMLRFHDEAQSLTKNELKLLGLLMEHRDRIVTRDECLEALWDDNRFIDDNTLTVNVTRLRKKLSDWGLQEAIRTKRGLGYQLDSNLLRDQK
ncbi:response regulator transcription factor [Kroppenstedtia pulmonis]|uniref:Response regulator transcription factor n=1 Tax=Kroppenstedtia pulmonis TaxID=1380685 RepID=A0A7D4BIV2_9BACL|nr:response regulator transcription factor [Kroppenstedtia pulmonis]QKG83910.1 response regulator transcription factor [Kroppenstedtia pulmonis]